MSKIRVLVADDSVVYRSQIKTALGAIPSAEVVGVASNGKIALDKLSQMPVDLLILDLEMPEMDGLQTLTELKKLSHPPKVLVFSSTSKHGSEVTMEALRLGASDFVTKPGAGAASGTEEQPTEKIKTLLIPKIEALFHRPQLELATKSGAPSSYPSVIWDLLAPKVIVIGSSTGGPTVLEKIFSQISAPVSCPILITQHMPPIFTATLAERLGKLSGIPAREAKNGDVIEKNHIYVAPGDFHMRLQETLDGVEIILDQGEKIHSVRPAVDPLFMTAAEIYKDKCLGFILTGMGYDGRDGAIQLKKKGGAIVIQSEATCIVFGMPGAVHAARAFDRICDPDEIVQILKEKIAPLSLSQDLKLATTGS